MRVFQAAGRLGVVAAFVGVSACVYVNPAEPDGNEQNFFWVVLDETKTRNSYKVVRLALIDAEGNQIADSAGPLDGKYRVVPPPLDNATPVETPLDEPPPGDAPQPDPPSGLNYLIELRSLSPQGYNIDLIALNPMALGYLSSRYIEIYDQSRPQAGETVTLALDTSGMGIGYGSGQLPVNSVPNIPPFFSLDMEMVTDGTETPNVGRLLADGFTPVLAAAIGRNPTGLDPGIKLDLTKSPPVDQSSVLAIASPDTGWFMLMRQKTPPGTLCRYWVFFTKNGDYSTLHLAYRDGEIPKEGAVYIMNIDFAGIPVPGKEALILMSLPDASRPAPYDDLSGAFVLTGGDTGAYVLDSPSPWAPIGRAPGGMFSEFTGWFDGGGYTLWDLQLGGMAITNYGGLFGYTRNALFQNIKIVLSDPSDLTVPDFAAPVANGFVAGYAAYAIVRDTHVTGGSFSVRSLNSNDPNYAGGVIGSGPNIDIDNTVTANFVSVFAEGGSTNVPNPARPDVIVGHR